MTDAVTHLRAIREQWGDLLHAIATPPPADWPPRQPSVQHLTAAAEDAPAVGRLPLILREHPAPLNLDALDATLSIEAGLFELADILAEVHQRSIRPGSNADRNDPDRWHYATPTWPGSRALGLHWCAVWLERALSGDNPLCAPVGVKATVLAAETIDAAHRVLQRALGRDGRTTVAPAPCPWCHGTLTLHATSGDPDDMTITCDTGPSCTAPARYDDHARRMWTGRDPIAALTIAILHAQNREPTA